ncbi:TetR/AcrR family transcriptional regulator [Kitasatospora sp. NPDC054939]
MSIHQRRERERAERHQLIIRTARELAEAEGWDAVTTRRLAERIEYSQPVLYSHFAGKDAIVAAVALEGFSAIAVHLRAAQVGVEDPVEAFAAMARAYTEFAYANPALYDAMFTMAVDLQFAGDATPAPLREAFGELADVTGRVAGGRDPEVFTETTWAALHGLVTLTRAGRLRAGQEQHRLGLLIDSLLGSAPVQG